MTRWRCQVQLVDGATRGILKNLQLNNFRFFTGFEKKNWLLVLKLIVMDFIAFLFGIQNDLYTLNAAMSVLFSAILNE
jgi:hypothetical protein